MKKLRVSPAVKAMDRERLEQEFVLIRKQYQDEQSVSYHRYRSDAEVRAQLLSLCQTAHGWTAQMDRAAMIFMIDRIHRIIKEVTS